MLTATNCDDPWTRFTRGEKDVFLRTPIKRYNHFMSDDDMKEMCDHPLLSSKEEKELGRKALSGDQKAIDKLVTHNIRLVAHIAKHFVTNRVSLGDAISIGSIGLINAAKRFDPDKGTKFSTYATWWIRDSLLDAYWRQKSAMIHVPTYIQGVERRISRNEKVTDKEREYLKQAEATRVAYKSVYDLPPSEDPKAQQEEENPDSDLIALVLKHLDKLLPEDQFILRSRFGLPPYTRPMLLEEVGLVEGVSKERIRQRQQRAIERLRALIMETGVEAA